MSSEKMFNETVKNIFKASLVGILAVVFAVVGLIVGGVAGLIGLFLMAGMLSKKYITDSKNSTSTFSANSKTLLFILPMVPAFIILFEMFGKGEGYFIVVFCGICLGIAGIRERLLLDPAINNVVITRRLLWAGLICSTLALTGMVLRYLVSGSILHSRNILMLVVVALIFLIPIFIYIWNLKRLKSK